MILLPTVSTRADTLFLSTALVRSRPRRHGLLGAGLLGAGVRYRLPADLGLRHRARLVQGAGLHTPEPVELDGERTDEHTSELQSIMCTSYAVFCLQTTKSYVMQ